MSGFPSLRMRLALAAYGAAWVLGMPLARRYIARRATGDPDYALHPRERDGVYDAPPVARPTVWIHAVSLGEFRSAMPLIRALLARGEDLTITHFTPAGRRESTRVLAPEIAAGRVRIVWVPWERDRAFRRFFAQHRPVYGLVMEVEYWPRMIAACRDHGVPLFLCNGQYPTKSYDRDRGRLRAELVTGFAGAMVKSGLQAQRFRDIGQQNVAVTGEMRFEQPVPPEHLAAAQTVRPWLAGSRPVVTIASAVEGEDDLLIGAIRHTIAAAPEGNEPLFVYVPRAPERFDAVADKLAEAGLRIARRSDVLSDALTPATGAPTMDVLLGDSFGEMYFYLALSDRVVVGGGFTPKGAHNVIEPMALKKPVLVGPSIWTIEYPAQEALEAGVLEIADDEEALAAALLAPHDPGIDARIARFFAAHAGAVDKTLAALPGLLANVRDRA